MNIKPCVIGLGYVGLPVLINLSKKFKDNNLIYQRTVEYLYPIKIVNNQNIFSYY